MVPSSEDGMMLSRLFFLAGAVGREDGMTCSDPSNWGFGYHQLAVFSGAAIGRE